MRISPWATEETPRTPTATAAERINRKAVFICSPLRKRVGRRDFPSLPARRRRDRLLEFEDRFALLQRGRRIRSHHAPSRTHGLRSAKRLPRSARPEESTRRCSSTRRRPAEPFAQTAATTPWKARRASAGKERPAALARSRASAVRLPRETPPTGRSAPSSEGSERQRPRSHRPVERTFDANKRRASGSRAR